MSGYLQRLAAGARSQLRLHPFVGSMFSRPEPAAAEPILSEVEAFPASEDRHPIGARLTTAAAPDEPARSAVARPAGVEVGTAQPAPQLDQPAQPADRLDAAPATFRPLHPRAAAETGGSAKAPKSDPDDELDAPPAQPKPVDKLHGNDVIDVARRAHPIAGDRQAEVNHLELRPTRRVVHERPMFASDPAESAGAELSAAARFPERRVDDVQIHIGRIEVVAVPSPSPSPTVPPVRKAMGLDEYLRQRSRGRR